MRLQHTIKMNKELKYVDYSSEEGVVFRVIETQMGQSDQGMEYVFNTYPDEIFDVCMSNIRLGLEKKLDIVPILIFEDLDFLVELEKIDFEDCLDNAINHFIRYEMYEKCAELENIKKLLQLID